MKSDANNFIKHIIFKLKLDSIFQRLAFKIKSWYNKFINWNDKITLSDIDKARECAEKNNTKYKYLKIGEKLEDNDILTSTELTWIVGRLSCRVKAGTIIDEYLYTFRPKRKIEIKYAKDI